MPEVARWQRSLADRVTVAILSGGSREQNLAKAQEYGVQRVLADEGRAIALAYGVLATPSAVLIDRDGTIAAAPAQGAAEILALVTRLVETPEKSRLARRALFGRAAVGLPAAAFLPVIASKLGGARRAAAAGGSTSVCFQRYALCTAAPCVASPTNPNISVCRCIVQDGPSFGNTACDQRAHSGNTLYSAYSLQNVTSSSTMMTCPPSVWANCLDVVCTVDPNNPNQASCNCVTVPAGGATVTFGGNCDTSTCNTVIWSAATPDMILQATAAYAVAVTPMGIPVNVPAGCSS